MLVSVILPVFNAETTLARAVDSILGQTWKDFELVAVDDGSEDGSAEVLRRAARDDRRVRVLIRPHQGIVATLNAGVAASRGGFIARMDADDVSRSDRLERQAVALREAPELSVVASRVVYEGDRRANRGYAHYVDWTNTLLSHEDIDLQRFVESPLAHPSATFRRTAWETWGGYREGAFPEDYELWLRWLDGGARFLKLPEDLLQWSDRPGRLSRRDPRYSTDSFYEIKADYLARWLERHNPFHPLVTVWGAGVESRRRSRRLEARGIHIERYVDIDPRRIGQTIHGRPVISREALPGPGAIFVIPYVGTRGARDLISRFLVARDYQLGRDFLCAA
jgi:glycosyltransferase involved in cell wall biosynthesis